MGKKRPTIEEVRARVALWDESIEVLSEEYNGCKSKIKCRCRIDGYIWESMLSNVIKRRCARCNGHARLDINDVRESVAKMHPTLQVLDDIYINYRSKLDLKCTEDGYLWEAN